MKVNIICPSAGWILRKFAESMRLELEKLRIETKITGVFDPEADINHYFQPHDMPFLDNTTTFMITHVDNSYKLEWIKEATEMGGIGICMSKETRDRLIAGGIKANRVCYIHPAQDGQIRPRKVVLGFTHRIYSDNRKRSTMILDVCKQVNPDIFKFVIMGAGWDEIVIQLKEMGFETEYYHDFDKQKYNEIMTHFDYYCYFGFDEGSMGFLDAIAAGIGTIVTPQGYHLDTGCDITYPVSTIDEIVDALHDIERKLEKNLRFIETWTWKNYALKHLEIWKYMLASEDMDKILASRGWYTDGIYSLLLDDNVSIK